jgi:hypothetical protein
MERAWCYNARAAAAIADFDHGHHEIIVDVDDA